VVCRQVVEQSSSLSEQDGYDVQLKFVELTCAQQRLGRAGAVHHHVAVAGGGSGLRGALPHVGDVADAAGRGVVRDVVGEDEDWYAVVVVAVPAAGVFVGAAAGDHGAGGVRLVGHLAAGSGVVAPVEPVEQPEAADAHRLVHAVLRPGDVAVHGHGHIQPDGRHGYFLTA
jgi:hypothetical protein